MQRVSTSSLGTARRLIETVFGREADAGEVEAIVEYLRRGQDQPGEALSQVVWSVLTSAEFRFNH